MRGTWLLAAASALTFGCASGADSVKIDDKKLAHVPVEDKQDIIGAQKNVDVAASNVTTAEVSKGEADDFKKIAQSELDNAKSHRDVARQAIDLGKQAHAASTLSAGEQREDAARKMLNSAQSKMEYANRLVDLRQAKLDEAKAELENAKLELTGVKMAALKKNKMVDSKDEKKMFEARRKVQDDLAANRFKVAQAQGAVEASKNTWEATRNEFRTAATQMEPITAPPPAEPVPLPKDITTPQNASKREHM